jgi:hypothetical protein
MLAETSATSTMDLTLLSRIGWDFGSRNRISTLYIDQAWLLGPFSVVKNCKALQPLLAFLTGGAGSNATAPAAAAASYGGFASLLKNCAETSIKKMPGVRNPQAVLLSLHSAVVKLVSMAGVAAIC